ncbi:MAG: hypothetical protein CVV33_05545, partial [Methanomicrobiales archaeon HGW-Methanomicrobiales-4]
MSSKYLNQICEVLPDALCILDTKLIIKVINSRFLSIFQQDQNQIHDIPLESAIPWNGNIIKILKAARQVLSHEKKSVEIVDIFSRSDTPPAWYRFVITPIYDKDENSEEVIFGILISAIDITLKYITPSDHTRFSSLINITHEILSYNLIPSHDLHPDRLLKQLVSRLGPALQTEYVSFIEFTNYQGEISSVTEEPLWSLQYGFLIGEPWDGDSPEELKLFNNLILTISETGHSSFNGENAHEIFQRMMMHRDVSEILVLPVCVNTQSTETFGCLVLWDNTHRWTDIDITILQIITDCIGTYMNRIRLETDLARSEEKFKGVIEYIGDMYYLTDKSGALLEISPSMIAALGYMSPENLIGKSMQGLLKDPDIWPLFLSDILTGNGVKD